MSSSFVIAVIIFAIAFAIFLNFKFKINLGISGFVFAYIIGTFFMKMKATAITNLWPASSVIQIFMILWFFGYASENGTMTLIAKNILYFFRKAQWALPYVVWLAGFVIGAFGAAPPAGVAICVLFAYGVGKTAGWHPMMLVPFVATSTMAGSLVPWGASGPVVSSFIENNTEYGAYASILPWKMMLWFSVTILILCTIYYIIFKGWKTNGVDLEKPEPMNKKQKTNLVIMLVYILLLVVPSILKALGFTWVNTIANFCDIRSISMLGVFVLTILKVSDARKVMINYVPWGTLIMIAGISTLLNLAFEAGVQQLITEYLSQSVSPILIAPLFAVMGGILSCFAGAINVVFPLLASMVSPLVALNPELNPVLIYVSIAVGASATGQSPFSSGGAMVLGSASEYGYDGAKLTIYCIVSAVLGMALSFVFALTGIFAL